MSENNAELFGLKPEAPKPEGDSSGDEELLDLAMEDIFDDSLTKEERRKALKFVLNSR